jgi:hypothetical protein
VHGVLVVRLTRRRQLPLGAHHVPLAPVVLRQLRRGVGLALTPRCQIGYRDRTGCHRLVLFTARSARFVASLPGVRLVTWTAVGVVNWCFDRWVVTPTPGCQIGYMDHTGCHQLVKSAKPYRGGERLAAERAEELHAGGGARAAL